MAEKNLLNRGYSFGKDFLFGSETIREIKETEGFVREFYPPKNTEVRYSLRQGIHMNEVLPGVSTRLRRNGRLVEEISQNNKDSLRAFVLFGLLYAGIRCLDNRPEGPLYFIENLMLGLSGSILTVGTFLNYFERRSDLEMIKQEGKLVESLQRRVKVGQSLEEIFGRKPEKRKNGLDGNHLGRDDEREEWKHKSDYPFSEEE